MNIIERVVKLRPKTFIQFGKGEEHEAISFLERQVYFWKKYPLYRIEMTDQEKMLNKKDYIKSLVKVLRKKLGTSIKVTINSPIKLELHGRFKSRLNR